jgi:hypothetical protein
MTVAELKAALGIEESTTLVAYRDPHDGRPPVRLRSSDKLEDIPGTVAISMTNQSAAASSRSWPWEDRDLL